jgi:DNA-binding CsgD family transcriptional regulator
MRDVPQVAEMIEIAGSTAPLPERAQGLLQALDGWLPTEATWLALSDPETSAYTTVGSTGLERSVVDYLDRPEVAQEVRLAELNQNRPPVSLAELPIPVDELSTWTDCLIPAGFREGLGVPLFEPGGPYLGMLTLLFARDEAPSAALRNLIGQLAPLIARGVSPMRSLLATARLVQGATCGAVLLRDGILCPLPGLDDHALLARDSPVVEIARRTLRAGQVYRSFLWPAEDGDGATGHARMTVLAATDVPAFVLGTVLLTPDEDCRGLTPRELQVLGLLVDGRSNQQIARQLAIAPRTAAAHVEHILHKLDTPTRTLAAVRAEREGCYVPPPPDPRARSERLTSNAPQTRSSGALAPSR